MFHWNNLILQSKLLIKMNIEYSDLNHTFLQVISDSRCK